MGGLRRRRSENLKGINRDSDNGCYEYEDDSTETSCIEIASTTLSSVIPSRLWEGLHNSSPREGRETEMDCVTNVPIDTNNLQVVLDSENASGYETAVSP